MSRFVCLFACLGTLAGCGQQAATASPPVSEAYRADIENLCEVVVRSGADKMDPSERTLVIANWLAARFQTSEAHDYLIRIQPLAAEPKAVALDAEARRVGLSHCALAAEWRGPSPAAH